MPLRLLSSPFWRKMPLRLLSSPLLSFPLWGELKGGNSLNEAPHARVDGTRPGPGRGAFLYSPGAQSQKSGFSDNRIFWPPSGQEPAPPFFMPRRCRCAIAHPHCISGRNVKKRGRHHHTQPVVPAPVVRGEPETVRAAQRDTLIAKTRTAYHTPNIPLQVIGLSFTIVRVIVHPLRCTPFPHIATHLQRAVRRRTAGERAYRAGGVDARVIIVGTIRIGIVAPRISLLRAWILLHT